MRIRFWNAKMLAWRLVRGNWYGGRPGGEGVWEGNWEAEPASTPCNHYGLGEWAGRGQEEENLI